LTKRPTLCVGGDASGARSSSSSVEDDDARATVRDAARARVDARRARDRDEDVVGARVGGRGARTTMARRAVASSRRHSVTRKITKDASIHRHRAFARAVRARVRIARVRVDGAGGDARDDARRDDGGGINVPTDDDDE
tara:strand:- start:3436 stop:3852 length:417 start_codon:yes stop_codon:yes gene_type:complete